MLRSTPTQSSSATSLSKPQHRRRVVGALMACLALAGTAQSFGATSASAATYPAVCSERADGGSELAYGLTVDQRLICFKVNRPRANATLMRTIELAGADTALIGIDVRPATGAIIGLGNAGGLYLLDPAAKKPELKARVSVPLEGKNFGMDFNPTVDRLRIVSDTGQNLRVNVDTGAATVDGFIKTGAVRTLGVGGVAYTNNDNDASTATVLFDLDSVSDQLVIQNPPNDGTLNAAGRLGFQGDAAVAFDIKSTITDGKATDNFGFAALGSGEVLFSIDLKTGRATFIDSIGTKLAGLSFAV
jgi:hypothetical protein